jgi:hypothetical protein
LSNGDLTGRFDPHIRINRNGRPIYLDNNTQRERNYAILPAALCAVRRRDWSRMARHQSIAP